MRTLFRLTLAVVGLAVMVGLESPSTLAQGQAPPPAPNPARPQKFEMTEGTVARYKVREQLAGISFPSEAVGTTSGRVRRNNLQNSQPAATTEPIKPTLSWT